MFSIYVFSVPQWQKRYTLQGDFTTAYIVNHYLYFKWIGELKINIL